MMLENPQMQLMNLIGGMPQTGDKPGLCDFNNGLQGIGKDTLTFGQALGLLKEGINPLTGEPVEVEGSPRDFTAFLVEALAAVTSQKPLEKAESIEEVIIPKAILSEEEGFNEALEFLKELGINGETLSNQALLDELIEFAELMVKAETNPDEILELKLEEPIRVISEGLGLDPDQKKNLVPIIQQTSPKAVKAIREILAQIKDVLTKADKADLKSLPKDLKQFVERIIAQAEDPEKQTPINKYSSEGLSRDATVRESSHSGQKTWQDLEIKESEPRVDNKREPELRAFDNRESDLKTPHLKNFEVESPEKSAPELRISEVKVADTKTSEFGASDFKTTEYQVPEDKARGLKGAEHKLSGFKFLHRNNADTPAVDVKTPWMKAHEIKTSGLREAIEGITVLNHKDSKKEPAITPALVDRAILLKDNGLKQTEIVKPSELREFGLRDMLSKTFPDTGEQKQEGLENPFKRDQGNMHEGQLFKMYAFKNTQEPLEGKDAFTPMAKEKPEGEGEAGGKDLLDRRTITENTQKAMPEVPIKDSQLFSHTSHTASQANEASVPFQTSKTVMYTDHESLEMVRQITKGLVSAAKDGIKEIRVQLIPRHLGRVQISLEMKADAMTGKIAVENDSVRQVVESHLHQLRESLQSQNIKVESLEVTVGQENSFLADKSDRHGKRVRRGYKKGRKSAQEELSNNQLPFPNTGIGRRWGYNTMELVA